MKTLKIFIIVGGVTLFVACSAAFYIWYTVQKIDRSYEGLEIPNVDNINTGNPTAEEKEVGQKNNTDTTDQAFDSVQNNEMVDTDTDGTDSKKNVESAGQQKDLPQEESSPENKTRTSGQGTVPNEAVEIEVSDMTSAQRKMLEAFGHTDPTFTITPEMVSCAKNAVSDERYSEILNGAAPTPFESLKLLPCFAAGG